MVGKQSSWQQWWALCWRWLLAGVLGLLVVLLLANTALLLLHLLAVCCVCFAIAFLVVPRKYIRYAFALAQRFLRIGRQYAQLWHTMQQQYTTKKE
jgi:uncharacterized membrane protein HdeD (DUF308 family)